MPDIGPGAAILAVLGGWWRVQGLHQVISSGDACVQTSGWSRIWWQSAILWSVFGSCTALALCAEGFGMDAPWATALRELWRLLTVVEMFAAAGWICSEASDRGSRWAMVLMMFAISALVVCAGLQIMLHVSPEILNNRLLAAITMLVIFASGITAPLLISDGASRMLQAISSDALENEPHA